MVELSDRPVSQLEIMYDRAMEKRQAHFAENFEVQRKKSFKRRQAEELLKRNPGMKVRGFMRRG